MSKVELRHLRTILALRDAGSLVEAAERLFLTQSALSHQLKDLENRLGCSLFVRKTRPVRFTSVGERLLKLAEEILPQFDGAMNDVTRLIGGDSGRLYMAIECHSCFEWLLPAINEYRESWPDVELDVSSGFHFEPLPALVRGDLDLVITADPIRDLELTYMPLFGYEAVLAVATDHPLAKVPCVNATDLAEETLITYPVDRSRLDIFSSFLEPAGVEPSAIRTAELTTMMIQLVASGRGVVCLPNWALHEHVEKNYVVAKSLGEEGIWPNLYAAVRPDEAPVAFIASFVETAKKTCFATLVGIVPADEDVVGPETLLR
ncbi:MAG: LysR family transcriptional regulator [Gammaproteobacteria bacterium]|mgnify:FL=1|uniref:HTH-type transcriptional regulator MetR n=1 Tax=marine metagenome TaxID=408172 RepID=A0A381P5R6_9ZZZZ|nr:LysR family transcriptional regulator [Gammaproteobacteria bacterium]MBN84454.1 LysR family transcriptional regulator [Gammaproteobacteria bacterium]|tara:strand:- start:14090 stop:15046 length:957 start_codon:yes stop_codon:yes gene_type:complete